MKIDVAIHYSPGTIVSSCMVSILFYLADSDSILPLREVRIAPCPVLILEEINRYISTEDTLGELINMTDIPIHYSDS